MRIPTKAIVLFAAAFSFCVLPLSRTAFAKVLVHVIYLSPAETARAKHTAQELKEAQSRLLRAREAWQSFYKDYEKAHPELANLRFTSDFRFAIGKFTASKPVTEVALIQLSPGERKKAESLHRKLEDAEKALPQAMKNWTDFQYKLVSDHFPNQKNGQMINLKSGRHVVIPSQWNLGVAFAQDFRVAVPRSL